jgi:hypothetical protein
MQYVAYNGLAFIEESIASDKATITAFTTTTTAEPVSGDGGDKERPLLLFYSLF